jgi:hypothetical protein
MLGALALSGLVLDPAMAEEKKAQVKVVAENAKVRVTETTYAPGAEGASASRAQMRVVRALKGGTLLRTFADGRKETVVYKTGQVRINEPGPDYATKNVGKGALVLYVVTLK